MTSPQITIGPATVGVEPSTAQQSWEILVEADTSFIPPLSARTSGTQTDFAPASAGTALGPQQYFESLQDQHIIVARAKTSDMALAGFMSFRRSYSLPYDHSTTVYHYVTTVIVRPAFRGHRITQRMYRTLQKAAAQLGEGVATRTWSTNSAHIGLLSALGFTEAHRIPDDRGQGVDTVYFVKSGFHNFSVVSGDLRC